MIIFLGGSLSSCRPLVPPPRDVVLEPPPELPAVEIPAGPRFRWPLKQDSEPAVNSPFGARVVAPWGTSEMHRGIDLPAGPGTVVVAARDGRIAWTGERPAFGWTIIVEHPERWITVYGNLDAPRLQVGDLVSEGAELGTTSTHCDGAEGGCLHFEIRWQGNAVDPLPLLTRR